MAVATSTAIYNARTAQKVFDLPEIREMILLELRPEKHYVRYSKKYKPGLQALLACCSVNQSFQATIAHSKQLQQALFLEHSTSPAGEERSCPPYFNHYPTRNILFHSTTVQVRADTCASMKWEGAVLRVEWFYRRHPSWDPHCAKKSSWRKMLLTAEPTWVRVWIRKEVPLHEHNTIRLWDRYTVAPSVRLGAVLDELTTHLPDRDAPHPNRNVLHGLA